MGAEEGGGRPLGYIHREHPQHPFLQNLTSCGGGGTIGGSGSQWLSAHCVLNAGYAASHQASQQHEGRKQKYSLSDLPTVRKCGLLPVCSLRPPWLTRHYRCLRPAGSGLTECGDRHRQFRPSTSALSPLSDTWAPAPSSLPSLRLRPLRSPSGLRSPAGSVLIPRHSSWGLPWTSVLTNKCSSPLVNHVKHHTQGQLVRTRTTTFLQGEDIEGTKYMQGCTWAVPSLPAQHILAPLPRAPGQLDAVSPSPVLEETRSSFWLVTGAQTGWADTTPPGTTPTPQLTWCLVTGSQNQKSHQHGSCVRSKQAGGVGKNGGSGNIGL